MKSDSLRGCFLAFVLILFGSALAFGQEATVPEGPQWRECDC
jgi:hypothetical protein